MTIKLLITKYDYLRAHLRDIDMNKLFKRSYTRNK